MKTNNIIIVCCLTTIMLFSYNEITTLNHINNIKAAIKEVIKSRKIENSDVKRVITDSPKVGLTISTTYDPEQGNCIVSCENISGDNYYGQFKIRGETYQINVIIEKSLY